MPVEIKQLVIASKSVSDDSKREQTEAERSNGDVYNVSQQTVLPYHLIHLAYDARER